MGAHTLCVVQPCIMTPTRTDTTLRQRRRALERISLNNPHSNLHSDATRSLVGSGACSTAAARVSNEQGSSRMCGDPGHTREQLINWVMSKDAVASCFIKDVLSMSESEHGGGTRLPARSLFSQTYPSSIRDRSSLLLSRSCTLQICLLGCRRSRSCSVRTSCCLHA
jgi:hypothetical protein